MMTEFILIFPLIASLILFWIKSKKLNNCMLILCSLLQLILSIGVYIKGPETAKTAQSLFNFYFKTDSLNILFLLVLSVIFVGVAIYNYGFSKSLNVSKNEHTYYSMCILLFIFSMLGVLLSTNLGLSWVFIEATTLTSAYLIYFNKTKHSLEAAWKYVFICSIGISLAFVGIILLSIGTGQINSLFYSDLYLHAQKILPFWLKLSFVFILIGFGTKMGLAPVHAWLPDAHSEAPSPVSALLSATLLNSAFLIILRVYKLMELTNLEHYGKTLLLAMGLLSLFVTAVFISNINNYKRMLAYSSIENMGIMAIGTAVGGLGLYAAMLHLIAHSLFKSSFFLTAGNILKQFKTKKIDEISGILKQNKATGWIWILCFVGIAGLPPSPLFISEFLMFKAMFEKNQFLLAIIFGLLLTVIIYGISKSVIKMSFGNTEVNKSAENTPSISLGMYLPQVVFITAAFAIGIYMPPCLSQIIHNAVAAISLM